MVVSIELILSLSAILISLASLGIAVWQTIVTRSQFNENRKWAERTRSLEYRVAGNETFKAARTRLEIEFGPLFIMKPPIEIEEIDNAVKKEPNPLQDIRTLIGHWGSMAVEIENQTIDEELSKELSLILFCKTVWTFENFVIRAKNRTPHIYDNLWRVYERWLESHSRRTELGDFKSRWSSNLIAG